MGARIKAARMEKKISQAQLGSAASIGKGMVSAIELGRYMPSVRALAAIAAHLGTGIDALVFGRKKADTYRQPDLPGMSVNERIEALPEAMREFVLLSLARAEHAKNHVPAQFMRAPTSENWPEFAAYLEALSKMVPIGKPE